MSARPAALLCCSVFVIVASACRSSDVGRPQTIGAADAQAASAPSPVADVAEVAAANSASANGASAPASPAGDAGTLPSICSARPLPAAERLVAPFRGTSAHGFVALTSTDRAAALAKRRVVASIGSGEAIDPARPVLLASFTKLFTAVATLRMVERGELSLDDTIAERLPSLASRPWASSTLRELLMHVSRVPEFDEKNGFYRRADVDFTSPVPVLAANVPRDWAEKRGVYKYRNAEAAMVGAILAARSELPAERVLAREVWGPAGMKNAGLLVGARPGPQGLDRAPMGGIRPQNFFTAGAGYASAEDLLAFFEALAGTELLTSSSKALLFDGAKERGDGALSCWAYAFPEADGGTTRLVERSGSLGNVRLFSAFFPEEERAIVAWTGDGVEISRPRSARGLGPALARAALE